MLNKGGKMEEQSTPNVVNPKLRSIGDLIKDPVMLLYKQWAPLLVSQAIVLFGTILVVFFAMFIFLAPLFYGIFSGMKEEELLQLMFTGYFWIALFFMIVPIFVIGAWGYAAMIWALKYKQERMAPIGEVLKKGLQLLPPMLVLTVVTTGAMFGASLMLFVPAMILAVGLSITWYIRVLEGTTIWEAIGTSWEITKGYRWAIFGRLLLFMLMVWGIMVALAIIGMVPIMGLVALPVQFALNFVITPYAFAYFFFIYEDLRAARKGVYQMKSGLSIFMIISWALAVAFTVGVIITAIYLIQTHVS